MAVYRHTFIKLNRGIMENPLWQEKPFTKAQAWISILLHTCSFDIETEGGKKLERGKCYVSQLEFSKEWGWNRKKVAKFLKELEEMEMVTVLTGAKNGTTNGTKKGTILTVVKWDFFQYSGTINGTKKGTKNGAYKKNNKEIGEENQKISSPTEKENSDWFDSL